MSNLQIEFLQDLSHLYRSRMPQFAWVSANRKQISSWTNCKAHLQDDMYAFLQKSEGPTYKSKIPLDLENVRIMIKFNEQSNFLQKTENILDLLYQYESEIKFAETTYEVIPNGDKTILFIGEKRWQISLPMLSLYTLLIRGGINHAKGTPWRDTIQQIIDKKIDVAYYSDHSYFRNSFLTIKEFAECGLPSCWTSDMKKNWVKSNKNYSEANTHGDGITFFATNGSSY